MRSILVCGVGAGLAIWAAPQQVTAATITWGPATTISADADVSTAGTLLSAHNLGGPTVLINGVTFTATGVGNIPPFFVLTSSANIKSADNGLGSTQPPFADLSRDYKNLLDSGVGVTSFSPAPPPPVTLLIQGLTVGQLYEFQWWVNDSRLTSHEDRATTATSGASVTLEHNFANVEGGVGQFAIGTFLTDAATQTIVFQGTVSTGATGGSTSIMGFQLRCLADECACLVNPACGGDVNGDGIVNGADLGQLLLDFAVNDGCPVNEADTLFSTDLTLDGVVNGADLGQLLLLFNGRPCP